MTTTQDKLVESGALTIRATRENELYLIEVYGEMDMSNVDALDTELIAAEQSGAGHIVLDLSGLDFIDSSGIRLLVIAQRRSDADSNRLDVLRGSGQVARVMALTGLDSMMRFAD